MNVLDVKANNNNNNNKETMAGKVTRGEDSFVFCYLEELVLLVRLG